MLCVTGNEASPEALDARLALDEAPLHEVRLDALQRIDDEVMGLLQAHASRVLVCCRPGRQGGAFGGEERERLALLGRAAATGVRFVDVEHDVADAALEGIARDRLVLSWHDFEGVPGDVAAIGAAMAARAPAVVKLAAAVDDAADLARLRDAVPPGPARVVIGMGAAGLLSRVRYAAFGSAWTYVAAGPDRLTAPGQLDLGAARALGLPAAGGVPFSALVGGPQVMRSPGPRVYNALFAARGLVRSYLPVVTRDLGRTLPLLEALGADSLSVTMPCKQQAFDACEPDAVARALGAVNSLRRDAGAWHGTNTDVVGVEEPLRAALGGGGTGRALILGAGGAARAAAEACRRLGLSVALAARRPAEGQLAWETRGDAEVDVLVNATPVGGTDSPWPGDRPLPPVVFDLALTGEPSALLARAEAAGAVALGPERMWLAQGAAQMRFLLGLPVTAGELAEVHALAAPSG